MHNLKKNMKTKSTLTIIALLINNLLSLTLGFLIIFFYHNNIVIAREEKLSKSIFGKRYEEYCRKVNRWGIF